MSNKSKNNNNVVNNLVSYDIIYQIYKEIKHELFVSDDKIGTYNLNQNAFENIKKRVITAGFTDDETYSIKNENQQKLVLLFIDYLKNNIRYVDFTEYI